MGGIRSILSVFVATLMVVCSLPATAADEDLSVTETFSELKSALENDSNISPEVRDALNRFGKAVSNLERRFNADEQIPSGVLQNKISEWFENKDRQKRLDGFFGTTESKGFLERFSAYGDFRFRLESTTNSGGSTTGDPNNRTRTRYRVRLRVGGEYEVAPNTWVGARLVTGSQSDPQSSHQTMTHNFQKWDVNFDRIYLHWAPFNNKPCRICPTVDYTADFWLGKFGHDSVFKATSLLWDSSVQPEGIAIHNVFRGLPWIDEIHLNLAGYSLVEDADQQDASMAVMQVVLKKNCDVGLPAPLEWTFATGLYDINDTDTSADGSMIVSGGLPSGSTPTLVNRGGAVFQSHYELLDTIVEMQYRGIEFLGKKRPLKLTFDYIYNTNAAEDHAHGDGKQNRALAFFATFGEAKKKGDWCIGGAYFNVQRDGVYAPVTTCTFPVIGNMKGGWVFVDYALYDKVVLRLWGVWDNPLKAGAADEQDDHFRLRIQIDVKF
ncbi:MAG: putative porin [Planctomycetota bacterium]